MFTSSRAHNPQILEPHSRAEPALRWRWVDENFSKFAGSEKVKLFEFGRQSEMAEPV
jgi:hypothetical protein